MPIDKTTHIAIVKDSANYRADVRIDSLSSNECNGCMIASTCNLPGITTLPGVKSPVEKIDPGKKVIISPIKSTPWIALIITFLIPLIIIIAGVIIMSYFDIPQLYEALAIIGFIIIYFFLLYRFHHKIEKKLGWEIIEILE